MNISKYIKIKCIPYVDGTATEYMRGIVCSKNVAHKKMRTWIKTPKIMVIYNSLDLDNLDEQLSFSDMLNKNESKLIKNIIEKIQ